MALLQRLGDMATRTGRLGRPAGDSRGLAPKGGQGQGATPWKGLSGTLNAYDVSTQEDRLQEKHTHVSSLVRGVCPRAFVLAKRFGVRAEAGVQPGFRVMWAMGRAIEKHIREATIAMTPEHVFGKWACRCKKYEGVGTLESAGLTGKVCEVCNSPANRYYEFTLFDEDREVAGNPDMPLVYDGRIIVIEIKSINAAGFDKLKASGKAETDHALQALYYRRMFERSGYEVADTAVVMYGCKEYKWGRSPYQEFAVREEDYAASLELMDARALAMKMARRAQGVLPNRYTGCREPTSPNAKACPVCSVCFSMPQGT